MEYANNGVNIVVLDASRANPYANSFHNATRGLAPIESREGILIASATAAGEIAADGGGRNSLFTKHLLEQMLKPGMQVERAFEQISQAVQAETQQRQTPFIASSLLGNFYFQPATGPTTEELVTPSVPINQISSSTIDGFSLDDWLLLYGDDPITAANLDKIIDYVRQHGGNAASRSYIDKGLQVAIAAVDSVDALLDYQHKFAHLPGANAHIATRLEELLGTDMSSEELVSLRAQFPNSAALRLRLAFAYHRARLFEAAVSEYQSWLDLSDNSHPRRKHMLKALVAAREGRSLHEIYQAGDIIQACPECPKMVYIPAGSFRMGDTQGSGGDSEQPVRLVNVSAFWLAQSEISFAQWEACLDAGGCTSPGDVSWGRDSRPVINVSWSQITEEYIPWLNNLTGEEYRLPSEAEWEYAARAGSDTDYSWGNTADHDYANYGKDNCCSGFATGKDAWEYTAPVESFAANAFGLYDMHGNVWEWTQDCWNASYHGAPDGGLPWLSGDCDRRVIRGGSWNVSPYFLRSALRNWTEINSHSYSTGFRLVMEDFDWTLRLSAASGTRLKTPAWASTQ